MKKQAFQEHIKAILASHSISLDNDDGTTEFEQYGDDQALVDTVFRGGISHLTINEDGEQLGGISFNVEDSIDIEYRDIKLINNSDAVECFVPEGIEVEPNNTTPKEVEAPAMFGDGKTLYR